ncbi:MAG: hypothetical protein ACPIFQ_01660 [Candidatus Puniceispirillaceae bacterium]
MAVSPMLKVRKQRRMMRQMTLPASVLSALKTGMGADWIRSRGLRTDLADAAFGHGWLDR